MCFHTICVKLELTVALINLLLSFVKFIFFNYFYLTYSYHAPVNYSYVLNLVSRLLDVNWICFYDQFMMFKVFIEFVLLIVISYAQLNLKEGAF